MKVSARLLAAAVAVVVTGTTVGALPAHAGTGDAIELSRDGAHWSSHLAAPLFDPALRWVPGDRRTARFYVRNNGISSANLGVDVRRVRDDRLVEAGSLRITARAGAGPWSEVTAGDLQELVSSQDLARGLVVPVDVRIALPYDAAPNLSMELRSGIDLRVTLADSRADGGTVLPETGATVPPWTAPLGLALLVGGGLVLVARRRSDTPPSP